MSYLASVEYYHEKIHQPHDERKHTDSNCSDR